MKKYYEGFCVAMAFCLLLAVGIGLVWLFAMNWKWTCIMVGIWIFVMGAFNGASLIGRWHERRKAAGK